MKKGFVPGVPLSKISIKNFTTVATSLSERVFKQLLGVYSSGFLPLPTFVKWKTTGKRSNENSLLSTITFPVG